MLSKYCKLVREYVALKQNAVGASSGGPPDEAARIQALMNIVTLNQSFINDINMLLPPEMRAQSARSGSN